LSVHISIIHQNSLCPLRQYLTGNSFFDSIGTHSRISQTAGGNFHFLDEEIVDVIQTQTCRRRMFHHFA